jgi:2-polyprenyl-3-methyl-5-hydroxy-6-metoxy-1,4-benzoquinol methylase
VSEIRGRRHETAHHGYLLPALRSVVSELPGKRLLDLGCGSGSLTNDLGGMGLDAVGVEFTDSYLAEARASYPDVDFVAHDLTQPLPSHLHGQFDVVTAVEVIEHLLLPRQLFARAREALGPEGVLVITTPYHGWAKNVAIALLGQSDRHYEPLVDFGHVKFFSPRTLGALAEECDFHVAGWHFVGRIKMLAKSMVMTARPAGQTANA